MYKRVYFDKFDRSGWPEIQDLEPYFKGLNGEGWFFATGNDGGALYIEGAQGSASLDEGKGRIDIQLMMWGNPDHGVLLMYHKYGGGYGELYSSKGDMSRIREWVRTLHNDARPVGLYIPFAQAWKAVKEFMETDGELPKSIEWVKNADLPDNTFQDPHDIVLPGETPVSWLSPEEAAAAVALGQGKL
jgi:Immunity protein Imm1